MKPRHRPKLPFQAYIDQLPVTERDVATDHANTFMQQGDDFPKSSILIPVAAHQESPETIAHAISQIAQQKTDQPFALALELNYPYEARESSNIPLARKAVQVAAETHDLDLRWFEQEFTDPRIGKIRKCLWDTALIAIGKCGNVPSNAFGVNHDIDLVYMSEHFMQAAQEHVKNLAHSTVMDALFTSKGTIPPAFTHSYHRAPEGFPNVARFIDWNNYTNDVMLTCHEAGIVLPFWFYAKQGGFDREAVTGETLELMDRDDFSFGPYSSMVEYHQQGYQYSTTSGRRFVQMLHTNEFSELWKPGSFTPHDAYRSGVDAMSDLSDARVSDLVEKDFYTLVDQVITAYRRNPRLDQSEQACKMFVASVSKKLMNGITPNAGLPELDAEIRADFEHYLDERISHIQSPEVVQ